MAGPSELQAQRVRNLVTKDEVGYKGRRQVNTSTPGLRVRPSLVHTGTGARTLK